MPGSVVDASVMAAWCFGEPRAAEAYNLIRRTELYSPTLMPYELGNVAARKAVSSPGLIHNLKVALATALALPIRWVEVDHDAVVDLAFEHGLTAYDASYLFLARRLDAPLVTFDERLAAAARS